MGMIEWFMVNNCIKNASTNRAKAPEVLRRDQPVEKDQVYDVEDDLQSLFLGRLLLSSFLRRAFALNASMSFLMATLTEVNGGQGSISIPSWIIIISRLLACCFVELQQRLYRVRCSLLKCLYPILCRYL